MSHKVTFFNIGNADSVRVELDNGKQLLFDYADMGDADDDEDLRCDLPREIRKNLSSEPSLDVVAFTHLDKDHYAGATRFFYFNHIEKYQGNVDGEPRVEMLTMWVPAAVITEQLARDADIEAKVIQKEARERFKAGSGVRVFSRPGRLCDWCERNDINLEDRRHLVTDAGQVVPGLTTKDDEFEAFVHSPFAVRQDENTVEARNNDALVLHGTFTVDGYATKLFLASDVDYKVLADIVEVTESKNNEDRLKWDICKLPHHCSHHSLSGEPREGDKSEPEPAVRRLFEDYKESDGIVVSTSEPVPEKGDKRDSKRANPPHRQAANYYCEDVVDNKKDFIVTMEHPTPKDPERLVIEIDSYGATVKRKRLSGTIAATSTYSPRAGATHGPRIH